jgi:hypothetical protein
MYSLLGLEHNFITSLPLLVHKEFVQMANMLMNNDPLTQHDDAVCAPPVCLPTCHN